MMVNTDANSNNTSNYKDEVVAEYGDLHLTSGNFQSAECIVFERCRMEIIDKALSSKSIKSFDTKATQTNFSLRRMQGSSVGSGAPFMYLGSVSSKWQQFTMFNVNQKMENALASNQEIGNSSREIHGSKMNLILGDSTTAPHQRKSTREYQLQPKSLSKETEQWTKSCELQMGTSSFSRASLNDFAGSSSTLASQLFTERRNLGSCACTSEENLHGLACTEPLADTEHFNSNKAGKCSNHSVFLLSEKERNCQIDTKILGNSLSGPNDSSLKQLGDSVTDNFSFQLLSGEHSSRMPPISDAELFRSYCSCYNLTKLDSEEQFPCKASACSIHNVETLIWTTLDSVDRAFRWHPKISNATQHMLIKGKTDIDLDEAEWTIGESMISARPKEISFSEMHMLPHGCCCFDALATKEQPLGNIAFEKMKDSDQFTNSDTINRQKISSIETATMDSDIHLWTSSSAGVTSSKSVKDTAVDQDLAKYKAAKKLKGAMVGFNAEKSEATSALLCKQGLRRTPITDLLDLNLDLPPCLDTRGSVGNKELSTSVTESLEAEQIRPCVRKQGDSNSWHPLERSPCSQPNSRWVKRLRFTSLNSLGVGTKDIEIEDASYSGRVNKLLSRVKNYSKCNSELTLARCLKERQQFDKAITFTRTGEASKNSLKKCDSWISRWCHNSQGAKSSQVKPEARVICKPLNARVVPATIDGRNYPSIAAMALMGKAVRNFHPCAFRKRGSLVVWNTGEF